MRPLAGCPASQPRSRKPSPAKPALPLVDAPSTSPVTFVLRNESRQQETQLLGDEIGAQDASPDDHPAETVGPVAQTKFAIRPDLDSYANSTQTPQRPSASALRDSPLFRPNPFSDERAEPSQQGSLTPLLIPPAVSSLPSSPKSISIKSSRPSEADSGPGDTGTRVRASSGEEELASGSFEQPLGLTPQLIMPSIKIPSRRPFTTRGKQMSSFKIMIAGGRGAGKTSLIKAIVQTSRDIVHVDPLLTNGTPFPRESAKSDRSRERPRRQRRSISEISASTKPFPPWRSEIEDSRILRRRISTGDTVLDRNLCFVETGYQDDMGATFKYMTMQLQKARRASISAGHDFAGLMSGNGGSQVDVIFYLLSKDTMDADIGQMKALSAISNVVPLISKADLLSKEELDAIKTETRSKLDAAVYLSVPSMRPGHSAEAINHLSAPYTVSSATGPDHEMMDASLLMSADYVPPLMPSELAPLVEHIFETDIMSYLRHTAAKKLIAWVARHPQCMQSVDSLAPLSAVPVQPSSPGSLALSSLSNSGALMPLTSQVSLAATSSSNDEAVAAMTRLAENTRQEEHLAQIRLSKWASDLQNSLQRERERFEKLAKGDRAMWLMERMGEEARDGRVSVLCEQQCRTSAGFRKGSEHDDGAFPPAFSRYHHDHCGRQDQDPLDLVGIGRVMQNRAWIAVQIMGSFGVLGGLAFWIAKILSSSSSSSSAASMAASTSASAVGGTGGNSNDWSPSWSWIRCY